MKFLQRKYEFHGIMVSVCWKEMIYKVLSIARSREVQKVYLRDSDLLHQLLGVTTLKELFLHPKVGASWEGFIVAAHLKAISCFDVSSDE